MNVHLDEKLVKNITYDELNLGDGAQIIRTLNLNDIKAFAAVSGDTNPAHLDPNYADQTLFHGVIAHGMWGGALISSVLGNHFPGAGTIYLDQTLHFKKPIRIGDTLTIKVTVISKDDAKKKVELNCSIENQNGELVLDGVAKVLAPTEKIMRKAINPAEICLFEPQERLVNLLALGKNLEPIATAVVHPCDLDSLLGAIQAGMSGLIKPILIGPHAKISHIAKENNIDLSGVEIIDVPHSHAAAAKAAQMAGDREVEAIMKGSLHTDELMHEVVANPALRTGHRLSHVFRIDTPMYAKPLLLTDAAINIFPSLEEKADIIQNAINFANVMGVEMPKVAILSAVETITPKIPSTVDAAALCKMAQRGQIKGGIIDGPLAFDNAISREAATIKNIQSTVSGDPDILMAPDLESANMLAKQLEYLGGATAAGIVLGAKVPIALTSRADGPSARIASALLAKMIAHHNRKLNN